MQRIVEADEQWGIPYVPAAFGDYVIESRPRGRIELDEAPRSWVLAPTGLPSVRSKQSWFHDVAVPASCQLSGLQLLGVLHEERSWERGAGVPRISNTRTTRESRWIPAPLPVARTSRLDDRYCAARASWLKLRRTMKPSTGSEWSAAAS